MRVVLSMMLVLAWVLCAGPGWAAPDEARAMAKPRLLFPTAGGVYRDKEIEVVVVVGERNANRLRMKLDDKALSPQLVPAGSLVVAHAVTEVSEIGTYLVTAWLDNSKEAQEAKILIVDPLVAEQPEPTLFHRVGGLEKSCGNGGCHSFSMKAGRDIAAGTECRMCHRREDDFLHAPYKIGACYFCHDTEAGFTPKRSADETCFRCHKDMKEALASAKYIHVPPTSFRAGSRPGCT